MTLQIKGQLYVLEEMQQNSFIYLLGFLIEEGSEGGDEGRKIGGSVLCFLVIIPTDI